jgi:hypothetical protein
MMKSNEAEAALLRSNSPRNSLDERKCLLDRFVDPVDFYKNIFVLICLKKPTKVSEALGD